MNERALALLFHRYRTRGDGRALAAVFDATARPLLDLACHLVRDPAEAEDLVQATFLAAIQRSAAFDESAPLSAWLYGILWREAAKARRRAARRVDPLRVGGGSEREPPELAAAREVPAAVRAALARLPPAQREVLEPLLFEEKRADRIARELARSPGTVRSQIHRGLEELRRVLAPRFAAFGVVALPTRGLASLRAEVLEAAGFPAATAATAPAAVLAFTIGGVLVSKSMLAATAAVAVALTGGWFVLERVPRAGKSEASAAEARQAGAARAAESPLPAGPTTSESTAPLERAPAASSPVPRPSLEDSVRYWLARFDEAPDDWRHGWDVAEEIAKLPPDEALAIMRGVWPHLSVPVKEQVLKPFVFHGGKPCALPILHLAATDAAPSVQARAFGYLKSYAFQDFALDYEAYLAWSAQNDERPLGEVLAASAQRFVGELLALAPAALAQRMRELDRLDLAAGGPAGVDLAAVIRDAGGLKLLEVALADDDPEVRARALGWSKSIRADERWLRAWVLPALEPASDASPEVLSASLAALARPDCGWAREPVIAYLERATQTPSPGTRQAGATLAELGDPAAVPRMIELLLHDRTGALAYDVGYFGLAKLTGVTWQEGYDGEWWANWWQKNRARFPAEVAALEVRR